MRMTWEVCDGHLLVTAKPAQACGCNLHFARVPLSTLWDNTLQQIVREMAYAMAKSEQTGCPYLKVS